MGVGFGDHWNESILDHVFGKAAYTAPANIFVALSTTDITNPDATGFTEAIGTEYSRISTAAADWNATGVNDNTIENANPIAWPQATTEAFSSGSPMVAFALFDLGAGGNMLAYGELTVDKPVLQDDTASFAAGALTCSINVTS